MATFRVRPYPCTRCGEKVVIVEGRHSGLGGLLRFSSQVHVQHADVEPAQWAHDGVDEDCHRLDST